MPTRVLNAPGRERWSPIWNCAFPKRLSPSQTQGLVRLPAEVREPPDSRVRRRMAGVSLVDMMMPVQGTVRPRA